MTTNVSPMRRPRPLRLLAPAAALLTLLALGHFTPAAAQAPSPTPWVTDGNNLYSTNSGNVGVGTQSPSGRLEVQGPDGALVLSQAGLATKTSVQAGLGKDLHLNANAMYAAGGWSRFDTAVPAWNLMLSTVADQAAIRRAAAGANPAVWADLLVVKSGGNVGIGTSSPTSKLHLRSGTSSASTLLHLDTGVAGGSALSVGASATNESTFDLAVNRPGGYVSRFGVSAAGHVYLQPGGSGGVGLGTSAPGATLDIQYAANDGTAGLKLGKAGVSRGFLFSDSDLRIGIDNNNDSASNAFSVYSNGSINSELFKVQEDGRVGVGTSAPGFRLDVQGGQVNASGGLCIAGDCKATWAEATAGGGPWATSGTNVTYAGGSVGVGIAAPSSALEVQAVNAPLTLSQAGIAGKVTLQAALGTDLHLSANAKFTGAWSRFDAADPAWNLFLSPSADYMGIRRAAPAAGAPAWADLLRITGDGKVGINMIPTAASTEKLQVTGNVKATGDLHVTGKITGGSIAAEYQDVAEWVPSSQELSAGTVVVLDTGRTNHVVASTGPYDTRVAGVVSARPGLILGEGGAGKFMVATTGRVKVRVDATRAPIRVGDLLVTSGVEGTAMKSLPLDFGGTPIHRPGTIVGKALEPLERGTGEILVLLSLQ